MALYREEKDWNIDLRKYVSSLEDMCDQLMHARSEAKKLTAEACLKIAEIDYWKEETHFVFKNAIGPHVEYCMCRYCMLPVFNGGFECSCSQ